MNAKILVLGIVSLVVIGGGVFAYSNGQNNNKESERMAMEKKNTTDLAMSKSDETKAMSKDGDAMAASKGSYSDYDQSKLANASTGKVVLFFHAPWCPTCRDANLNFENSATPEGLTLLKVDYDSSNELKKKYGVTYQHTFVQVDKDGNLLKKWNGSKNYDEIKAQQI